MSTEPSREADLHLAVDAFWARWCSMAGLESVDEHKVRVALEAVVRAFAVAGRLLPEGAGREWAAELDGGYPYSCDDEEYARWVASQRGCTGKVFARIVGPWQPITEETDKP